MPLNGRGAMERARRSMDMRVVKTRRAIHEALIGLLAEDDGRDITPREVADAALISKKTFLAHYGSVSEVIDEMEDEAAEGVEQVLESEGAITTEEELAHMIELIASMAQDKATTLGALLGTRVREDVVARLQALLRERIACTLEREGRDGSGLLPDFLAGGLISAFRKWLREGAGITPQDLSHKAATLARAIWSAGQEGAHEA